MCADEFELSQLYSFSDGLLSKVGSPPHQAMADPFAKEQEPSFPFCAKNEKQGGSNFHTLINKFDPQNLESF
jgi:hypothetical protein